MKKISYLGWILFAVTFIAMIYFAWPKNNTVDFRGVVDEVNFSQEENCTYIKATMIFGDSPSTIKVNKNISIKDYDGNKITAGDIKPGDMIDLNFKGKPEDFTAKWIRVYLGE